MNFICDEVFRNVIQPFGFLPTEIFLRIPLFTFDCSWFIGHLPLWCNRISVQKCWDANCICNLVSEQTYATANRMLEGAMWHHVAGKKTYLAVYSLARQLFIIQINFLEHASIASCYSPIDAKICVKPGVNIITRSSNMALVYFKMKNATVGSIIIKRSRHFPVYIVRCQLMTKWEVFQPQLSYSMKVAQKFT